VAIVPQSGASHIPLCDGSGSSLKHLYKFEQKIASRQADEGAMLSKQLLAEDLFSHDKPNFCSGRATKKKRPA